MTRLLIVALSLFALPALADERAFLIGGPGPGEGRGVIGIGGRASVSILQSDIPMPMLEAAYARGFAGGFELRGQVASSLTVTLAGAGVRHRLPLGHGFSFAYGADLVGEIARDEFTGDGLPVLLGLSPSVALSFGGSGAQLTASIDAPLWAPGLTGALVNGALLTTGAFEAAMRPALTFEFGVSRALNASVALFANLRHNGRRLDLLSPGLAAGVSW